MFVWLCASVTRVSLENHVGHMLPLGKQRIPESLSIALLQFSPGGSDFYQRYILQHSPVLLKGVSRHWPINGKWHNLSYVYEIFTHEKLPVLDSPHEKLFGQIIEFKHQVNTIIPKDSKLLQGVYLPLVLQCNELAKKISSVRLHMNNDPSQHIKFASSDILLASFATSQNVLLFATNNSLSGENLKSVDTEHVDVSRNPEVLDVPYQIVDLQPGDILYIPAYSWYHVMSTEGINYVKIEFDVFSYEFQHDIPYLKALSQYKEFLLNQSKQIPCSHTDVTMADALTIDFDDEEAILHLRIPKRNKRPDDVVLISGHKMPVLGFGTALLNESTYETVKYALSIGYRMFDTAYGYPHGEEGVGKALSESGIPREQVFIVTKLHPKFLGYNETILAIEESLKNLNTSYIDLFLIHSIECDDFLLRCDEGEPHGTWKESWRAMEHMKNRGKIRSLGVSNFYEKNIIELLNWSVEPVSVVQNWFDPYNQDVGTRKICDKYNIRYMGFSTLGSRWKLFGLSYNPVLESELITAIAGHYDYVISHVVLRWAIHVNVTVIPRSINHNHIAQNFRSLDIKLHQSDIESLNELNDWMEELQNSEDELTEEVK